jgi:dienelactone hydrolase
VPGLFVKPRYAHGPFPVIIALPGGHRTKDLTIFGHEQWPLPFEIESPHHRFPVERLGNYEPLPLTALLDHGFALMSIDARVFGARAGDRSDSSADRSAFTSASWDQYHWLMRRAVIDGRSVAAMEVWDVIRALDYLETRDDVDTGQIGCMGLSMGGNLSWMTAIIEPRIQAVCTVSCLTTFEAALKHGRDGGWYAWIPGIARHTSRQELLSMLAPRPLLCWEGDEDFPRDARQPMIDEARAKYNLLGVPDNFRSMEFHGGHGACLRDPKTLVEIGHWFTLHLDV